MTTVIILLILAAVTVSTLTGDSGIIKQTQDAATDTKKTQYKEDLDVLGLQLKMQKEFKGQSTEDFIDKYKDAIEKDDTFKGSKVEKKTETSLWVETPEGFVFEVTEEEVKYLGRKGEKMPPQIADGQIQVNIKPSGWTNQAVTVELINTQADEESTDTLWYSTEDQPSEENDEDWELYTGPFKVSENYTHIWGKLKNIIEEVGPAKDLKTVDHIDKEDPDQLSIETSDVTSKSVTVTATAHDHIATETSGCSEIDKYCFRKKGENVWHSLDANGQDVGEAGQTSSTYKFDNLADDTDYQFEVKVTDHAGNSKQETTDESQKVHTEKLPDLVVGNEKGQGDAGDGNGGHGQGQNGQQANMHFEYNPSTWTKSSVRVKIHVTPEILKEGYQIQYKLFKSGKQPTDADKNGEWLSYTEDNKNNGIEVTTNGTTIWARIYDGHNAGNHATGLIDNIDTQIPSELNVTTNATTNSITVIAKATDASATNDSGCSGIAKYYFQKDNDEWIEKVVEDGNSTSQTHKFENLDDNVEYTIKVKVEDKAGNVKELTSGDEKGKKVTTQEVKTASQAGIIIEFDNKRTIWCEKTNARISRTRCQ